MLIAPAEPADVEPAARALVSALAFDPLIEFFFLTVPGRRQAAAHEFFSLLLRARIELGMPVLVARDGGRVQGAVMGYDTTRPQWPGSLQEHWHALESSVPGMAGRAATYEAIADGGRPGESTLWCLYCPHGARR